MVATERRIAPEIETPSVIDIIARRIKENSQPGSRTENPSRKVGLVIQGGGMRGVIGGGMAVALETLMQESNPFDEVYGVSAGAWSGAFLLTRQTYTGLDIYCEHLPGEFIRFLNPLRGKPIVDANHLRKGLTEKYRLDAQKIVFSKVPLHVFATRIRDGQWHDFYPFEKEQDVYQALEATAHVPFYTGEPLNIDGELYVDGTASSVGGVPVWRAIEDGATDILVLWTDKDKPSDYPRPKLEKIIPFLWRKKFPEFSNQYWNGHNRHRETIHLLKNGSNFPRIEVIKVNEKEVISKWESQRLRLILAAKAGYDAVMKRFESTGLEGTSVEFKKKP